MSIHAFRIDGEIQIWTDCEGDSETDGRCLAAAPTLAIALPVARAELEADLKALIALKPADVQEPTVPGRRVGGMRRHG